MTDLDAFAANMTKDMTPEEATELMLKMPDSAIGSPLANALLAKIEGK